MTNILAPAVALAFFDVLPEQMKVEVNAFTAEHGTDKFFAALLASHDARVHFREMVKAGLRFARSQPGLTEETLKRLYGSISTGSRRGAIIPGRA